MERVWSDCGSECLSLFCLLTEKTNRYVGSWKDILDRQLTLACSQQDGLVRLRVAGASLHDGHEVPETAGGETRPPAGGEIQCVQGDGELCQVGTVHTCVQYYDMYTRVYSIMTCSHVCTVL